METRAVVKVEPIGAGAFEHDLQCWLCQQNLAVYRGYPNWDFVPCWDCQSRYVGVWTKRTKAAKLYDLLFGT